MFKRSWEVIQGTRHYFNKAPVVAKSADLAWSPGLGLEPYRKEQAIPVKASAKTQLSDPEERERIESRERDTQRDRDSLCALFFVTWI